MKMLDKNQLESEEQVEKRARQRINGRALIISAFLAAALVFVVPSGGPWMSTESFTNAMGRVLSLNVVPNLIVHFGLGLLYGWLIALSIFRLPLAGGILLGTALTFPLWGLNYLVLNLGAGIGASELHTFLAHLQFCLFFSVAYRAMAVPRPRRVSRRSGDASKF